MTLYFIREAENKTEKIPGHLMSKSSCMWKKTQKQIKSPGDAWFCVNQGMSPQ